MANNHKTYNNHYKPNNVVGPATQIDLTAGAIKVSARFYWYRVGSDESRSALWTNRNCCAHLADALNCAAAEDDAKRAPPRDL